MRIDKKGYYNRFDEEPTALNVQRRLKELSLKTLQQYIDKYDIEELEKQTAISEEIKPAKNKRRAAPINEDAAALSGYYDDKLETTHTELNELKDKLTNLNNWVSVIDSKADVADVAIIGNKKKRRITVRVRI